MTGNWKLNPQTREEAATLASEIAAAIGPDSPDIDVALFVPYVFIEAAQKASGGSLMVGAEVCSQPFCIANEYPNIQDLL
jgi:triosephosphate isomerase